MNFKTILLKTVQQNHSMIKNNTKTIVYKNSPIKNELILARWILIGPEIKQDYLYQGKALKVRLALSCISSSF